MKRNSYESLDLDVIKKEIASYAFIEDAKTFIVDEEVPFNPLLIKKNINDTSCALKILNDGNELSFDGIYNISSILDKADKEIVLNGNEINRVISFYNHSERIKKFFYNYSQDLSIRDYSDSIALNKELFSSIENLIDSNGFVKNNASLALIDISNSISENEEHISRSTDSFIKENLNSLQVDKAYERENRVVFLVKNVDKYKFGGNTYNSSSSNQSAYIEPSSFIELNNRRDLLNEEYNKEILRILKEITIKISTFSSSLRKNYESLVKLNVIFAKAMYGYKHYGILSSISNQGIRLIDACHPLIDEDKVVSNSYSLDAPFKGIIISGSNTGGKTVSLKLIGLSVILTYLGIPVIASESSVPIFDNVFVDVEDRQSIASSLSTFSSHLTNINEILNCATSNSLILIDELVSGTDPKEAQAISLAIIEKIKKIGSKFVITTHYDDIKTYAYNDEEILLSSVGFDMDKLVPTYKYLENTVGSSNALDIALKYIDDPDIITKAKSIMESNKTKENEIIDKLNIQLQETENKNKELDLLKSSIVDKEMKLKSMIEKFNNEKQELRKEFVRSLDKILEDVREKSKTLDKKSFIDEVNIIEKEFTNTIIEDTDFEVGDTVRINENETIGRIISLNKDNASVSFNGLTVKAKLTDLIKVNANQTVVKKFTPKYNHSSSVSHELNLIGKRVEEALDILNKYLDDAYASNYSSVRIIHGIGTGALRSAVHSELSKYKNVARYKLAEIEDGGSAVTIVEFKK